MKNNKKLAYSIIGLIILLLLFVWFQTRNKNMGSTDNGMLLDESATPAPYALIRIQEQPVFKIDYTGKPFATMEDIDDRSEKFLIDDSPLIIQE